MLLCIMFNMTCLLVFLLVQRPLSSASLLYEDWKDKNFIGMKLDVISGFLMASMCHVLPCEIEVCR